MSVGTIASALTRLLADRRTGQREGQQYRQGQDRIRIQDALTQRREARADDLAASLMAQRDQQPTPHIDPLSPQGQQAQVALQGKLSAIPTRPSGTQNAVEQKARLGARNASEAIQRAVSLLPQNPEANILPTYAEIAGSAAESKIADYIPGLRGAASALRRGQMSDAQNQFQNLLNVVAHNAVGLLPGSRQSQALFQNLRESYASAAGDPPGLRAQKVALLKELGLRLERLANGEDASLADLPGFEEFQPLGGSTDAPVGGLHPAPRAPGTVPRGNPWRHTP